MDFAIARLIDSTAAGEPPLRIAKRFFSSAFTPRPSEKPEPVRTGRIVKKYPMFRLPLIAKIKLTRSGAERYVRQVLREKANFVRGDFVLRPFEHGKSAVLFELRAERPPSSVIRFHRLRDTEKTEIFFGYNEYFADSEIPTPKILYVDRSAATRREFGCEVSVETFIEGDHFYGAIAENDEVVRSLASIMAMFHKRASPAHGLPWRPQTSKPYYAALYDRIEYFYRNVMRRTDRIEKMEARMHLRWFRRWASRFDEIADYRFVHGDFHRNNIIVRPGGEIVVLDFRNSLFGYPELDLVVSKNTLLGDSPRVRNLYFETYFEATDGEFAERYEKNAPFFEAYFHLKKLSANASKASKVARNKKREAKPYSLRSGDSLERLRRIVG